jgi:type IV pilus assembly protein PilY1
VDSYSETGSSTPFLWEFTDAQDADLGYTFGRPVVVHVKNKWVALFGNGYNNTVTDAHTSSTGNAVLYAVDMATGALLKKFDTGVGKSADPLAQARPNGLAAPAAVDVDGDGSIDYVYAGDLFGNLWKFNLTDVVPANWNIPYTSGNSPAPLFVAKDANGKRQPITSRPNVDHAPNGHGLIVLFGTGKYLESGDTDVSTLTTQTFYGVIDRASGTNLDIVPDRSQTNAPLTQQQITTETVQSFATPAGGTNVVGVRVVTKNPLGSNRGWYLDLVSPAHGFEGEMQVTNSVIDSGKVIFTTLIPNSDPCSAGGKSWLMVLDLASGGRLDTTPFDLNEDGAFNSNDNVNGDPTSGMMLNGGIAAAPAVVSDTDTKNKKDGGSGCEWGLTGTSDGNAQAVCLNPGPRAVGRQSWRQVR